MKRSMKTRLVAIFVVTIVIIIGVISLANVVLLPYFYQSNKVGQMQGVYSRVVDICKNVDWNKMDSEQKDTIYDKLDQLSSNTNMSIYLVQIRVYQGSGDIAELAYVYPSDSERLQQVTKNQLDKYVKSIYFGQKLDDNCKIITQTANYSMYNVYDTRVDSNFLELTGKMPDNYWIYLRSNYQSIQESAGVSNQFMLYVGMIVMIAGVFIMYFVSNQYTKPILRLAAHAKNMQKLDFSTRYKDNRDDEIGVLGNSMNALSDRLEKTISELKTANNLSSNLLNVGQILKIPKKEEVAPSEYEVYTVKSGDSLWSIATNYGVSVDDIINLNNLGTTVLQIGQQILIPKQVESEKNVYIVKAGDNLYSIANKYNITVNELKKANNLENNNLSIGQELIIPDYSNNDPIEKPINEITYIVQKGDSLWSIAKKYDINVNDLKSYNNLSSNLLNIGQTLLIPKTSDYQTYIVVSGDSLYKIANKFNTTIDKLKSVNNLKSDTLSIGQVLIIPN